MPLLTPELLRQLEQFQLLAARRAGPSPSAQRMNMNSRGCQPTEQRRKSISTLKGSNHESSGNTTQTFQLMTRIVRPLQGRGSLRIGSVGCTHGYSCGSPSANAALTRVTGVVTALVREPITQIQLKPADSMSTFTQIYYHLVFSTKDRERVLLANRRDDLFRYTWGILKNKDCHLYRIGGVEDHIHILTEIHPTIALADLVKDIKTATSSWIKKENVFPEFTHWQDGYGAFTVSHGDKDAVIEYIKGQEEHHRQISFKDELREFLLKHGIKFDEKYLV